MLLVSLSGQPVGILTQLKSSLLAEDANAPISATAIPASIFPRPDIFRDESYHPQHGRVVHMRGAFIMQGSQQSISS